MRTKNAEIRKAIREFVDEFFCDHLRYPSLREIEKALKISRQTAHRYLVEMNETGELEYDGHIRTPICDLADPCKFIKVPVAGAIPCGTPAENEEHIENYTTLPKDMLGAGEFFLLRANGDSMINAGIGDGDLVLIRRQSDAKEGQIIAALVDGDSTTLKRFYRDDKRHTAVLHPENSNYKDIESKNIIIQGIALKVIKDLE